MKDDYKAFFDGVNGLDNGSRAALRRSAGTMLEKADGKAIIAFYKVLPANVSETKAEYWFAVACLRCLWETGKESDESIDKVIGRFQREGEFSESMLHRITVLMDARWSDDGYLLGKLTRIVKMIRQKTGQVPDLSELIEDLTKWNYDNQEVQRKWARSIFTGKE